ncbi:CheR family methyltransferase [Wenxinia marina]|uniref:Chemotaxis protein methyltransferase n=1 Tax=Wenxinia marina DSM 24838 TaxID=1123501 RepID=A0A0D0PY98_9RHOB|nr:protein-glutamate O-methyltransferase CheR [Wenxinia marina]KIQ67404.1 Methylase of chemotaxis methyl-accepting protein [Wenxinia marina DSM 24838]GGL69750.1 chemotaxis protein methyltransferase [Wenxinia marina]
MTATSTDRTDMQPDACEFTEDDFAAISRIAKAEYGLHLEPSKKSLIRSRLRRRIRALGLGGFGAYCRIVENGDPVEREHFVSALTTNVTHFYREPHHFRHLEGEVLPPLIDPARAGERIRVWSAGCSTGPEPYSIAASILKVFPDAARFDVRILATDIDRAVLRRAEGGRYEAEECKVPDEEHRRRLFAGREDGVATIRPEVAGLVTFRPLNLNGPWPMSGRFHAIFCRNVAIYFDRPTQERLWSRFAEFLKPGGMLYIGHSERVTGPATQAFAGCGITTYRHTSAPRPIS